MAYFGNPFEEEIPKDMWIKGDMGKISEWLSCQSGGVGHDGFSVKCSVTMGEMLDRLDEIKKELRAGDGNDISLWSERKVLLSAIAFIKDARLNGRRVYFIPYICANMLSLAKNALDVKAAVLSRLLEKDSVYNLIHGKLAETFGEDAIKRFTAKDFVPYITIYERTLEIDEDKSHVHDWMNEKRVAAFSVEGVFNMEAFGRHHGLCILYEDDRIVQ